MTAFTVSTGGFLVKKKTLPLRITPIMITAAAIFLHPILRGKVSFRDIFTG